MNKKIVYVSDLDFKFSGYSTLSVPLLTGLANLGYQVECAGLNYHGEEHWYPFSIIPANDIQDVTAIVNNLHFLWQPDIIMVAMDLPFQSMFYERFRPFNRKYVCITPMENGPLTMSWAAPLLNMDAVFFISELGKQEAIKAGVSKAEHLVVGIDTEMWHPATPDEKAQLRKGLGIGEEDFVILTVADNQERKNLWAGMGAICMLTHETMTLDDFRAIIQGKKRVSDFPKTRQNVKHVLVTREHNQFGWKLRDLAFSLDITSELQIYERGIPTKDLWGLYAIADVYLSASKAEGLGIPVLDAMGCGIPVVATDTGALHELLEDGRGFLMPSEYSLIDVWGNSKRDMIDIGEVVKALHQLVYPENYSAIRPVADNALNFIRSRTWNDTVSLVDAKLKEMFDEKQA